MTQFKSVHFVGVLLSRFVLEKQLLYKSEQAQQQIQKKANPNHKFN